MQFIKNVHMKSSLLLTLVALCSAGCDDGPTQSCCSYFESSNAYISAIGDENQSPRELFYVYADAVRAFAKQNDQSDVEYLGAGEYLCSIMPEMKGINYDYLANDDKDAKNVCAASISKHSEMANKIKEAWDNCCYIMGSHVIQRKEDNCRGIGANGESEASSNCWKEFQDVEFKYLSCFRTYITTGACEYIID